MMDFVLNMMDFAADVTLLQLGGKNLLTVQCD